MMGFNSFAFLTLLILIFNSSSTTESPVKSGEKSTLEKKEKERLPQVIKPVNLENLYSFAGEPIPRDNFDAMERLDRELSVNSYWHSSTLLHIKSAKRWFPLIEKILAEEGVPEDFKYLAIAESSLRNVRSPAGASGFWQIRKLAAREMGLEINNEIDERYHIEKSTRAACRYIKKNKNRFGTWTLSAAAYNIGPTSLSRTMKQQQAESYYDINVSDETMRYIFRIVAIKEILNHPSDYGFYLKENDLYEPLADYNVIEVNGPVANWGEFAKEHGTSYRMLKIYNPWLRSYKLTNSRKKLYEIKVPA